jgi:soluble lytic murein transglycosylase
LHDPDFSVRLGTRYFRQVLDMFGGNQELALAGYNGGPYRIKKLWRQAGSNPELDRFVEGLSLEESKTYVKRILLFEDTYQRLYSEGS